MTKKFILGKRLKLRTDEISSVFNLKNQVSGKFIRIRFTKSQSITPKFAVIISKRIVRYAVERNYCKRVVRELFRNHQYQLININIIVQVLSKFNKDKFSYIFHEFESLLLKLQNFLTLKQ